MKDNTVKMLTSLVMKEARALKKYATKKEKDKLNFHQLYPSERDQCIYGQMTNNCFNTRAKKLIQSSCERVYNLGNDDALKTLNLNGSPKGKNRHNYFSPIEVFIYREENRGINNKHLIEFIQGKRRSFNFVK